MKNRALQDCYAHPLCLWQRTYASARSLHHPYSHTGMCLGWPCCNTNHVRELGAPLDGEGFILLVQALATGSRADIRSVGAACRDFNVNFMV